jgi:hypothetical protein
MKSEEPVRSGKLNKSDARLRKAEADNGILIAFYLNAGLTREILGWWRDDGNGRRWILSVE